MQKCGDQLWFDLAGSLVEAAATHQAALRATTASAEKQARLSCTPEKCWSDTVLFSCWIFWLFAEIYFINGCYQYVKAAMSILDLRKDPSDYLLVNLRSLARSPGLRGPQENIWTAYKQFNRSTANIWDLFHGHPTLASLKPLPKALLQAEAEAARASEAAARRAQKSWKTKAGTHPMGLWLIIC